jgi:nucleotidyltransferase/DNA polymerase involved in DNA repair
MLNPELKPYPIAVCGDQEERHGIVLAKNYKAKAFGVSTGEAIWQAQRKCPDLIVVPPHFDIYAKYSALARDIYRRYTDKIEPMGLDEAWCDITGSLLLFESVENITNGIRKAFKEELDGSTKIIIAQRISSVKDADSIIVMNDGAITGIGTHNELLETNAEYGEIYYSQMDKKEA